MGTKHKSTKKKMASLGLRKDENGGYTYIDASDKDLEFKPLRKK